MTTQQKQQHQQKRRGPKEGILVSKDRDQFFYYKKSKFNEVIVCPTQGMTFPPNRTNRVNKFVRYNENIQAEIADQIRVSCSMDLGSKDGIAFIYSDPREEGWNMILYEKIEPGIKTVINPSTETEMTASELKVFYITTDEGFFFATMDAAKKTAQFTVLDETGRIGDFLGRSQRRIMTLKSLWPELGIRLVIRNGVTTIFADPDTLQLKSGFKTPCIINLDRAFGNECTVKCDYALE